MKVFKKANLSNNWKCHICGKSDDKEVVFIGIVGTEKGNNKEVMQVHLDCINLFYDQHWGLMYQHV